MTRNTERSVAITIFNRARGVTGAFLARTFLAIHSDASADDFYTSYTDGKVTAHLTSPSVSPQEMVGFSQITGNFRKIKDSSLPLRRFEVFGRHSTPNDRTLHNPLIWSPPRSLQGATNWGNRVRGIVVTSNQRGYRRQYCEDSYSPLAGRGNPSIAVCARCHAASRSRRSSATSALAVSRIAFASI